MKRIALIAFLPVWMAACASLPAPGSPDDSLVIGSFSLYFPEGGYFDSGVWEIDRGIELDAQDLTTGQWIPMFLSGGDFWFLAHSGDTYEIVSARAEVEFGSRTYVFGERKIGLKIDAQAEKVLSLGEIRLTYNKVKDTWSFHPKIDYEIRSAGGMQGASPALAEAMTRSEEAFDVVVSQKLDDKNTQSTLKRIDPASPWLSRDIVDVKLPQGTPN